MNGGPSEEDHSEPGHREERADVSLGMVATASGEYSLRADGTFDEGVRVSAVIYDRLVTPCRAYLEVRLEACREYAAERGWSVVGEHLDIGEEALHHKVRPGLDAALGDVRQAARRPATDRAVLLVYNHGRLSHDILAVTFWQYQVERAGGAVTVVEQTDPLPHGRIGHTRCPAPKGEGR